MAESTSRKQQNQAFLQELEKQRLNKDCLRIIDLRGKVAGECQAYEFGERVHYLDDRAYLLVKQLMARFDGRYTTGVYEALFKALKQLDYSPAPAETANGPDFLHLDQTLQRTETRTVISTPLQIRLDDVLYHGHSIDLSPHAIRVSCKRTFSLELGDRVSIEFTELFKQSGFDGLRHVVYQIIKIDHDSSHTSLVLRLEAEQDTVSQWLSQWLEQQASPRQQDVDNELLNLQTEFYQRLWLSHLSSPLLWLSKTAASSPLLRLHMAPAAYALLARSGLTETDWFAKLPLTSLLTQQSTMICACNRQFSFSATVEQTDAVQAIINWHLATADSQLLLLQATPVSLSKDQRNHSQDSSLDNDEPSISTQFEELSHRVTVCDLTSSFTHSLPSSTVAATQLSAWQTAPIFIEQLPEPAPLRPCIHRDKARFYIHTPVTVHAQEQEWQLETLDVSADGLAIDLPDGAPISLNQRLQIDFSRWQTLTRKVKLDAIPYQIKNIRHWQGQHQLGLERIKQNCPESLNSFFDWVIQQNQQSLRHNHQDKVIAAEGQLLSEVVLPTLHTVPVFLGLDSEGQRRVLFIGQTQANQAAQNKDFWQGLEQQMLRWNNLLKQAGSEQSGSLSTTLYSYKSGQYWTHAFEEDFSQTRDKALFIQRALGAEAFRVMQTTISVLTGHEAELEHDLVSRLQQWRSQRAHRIRAIRQQLSQLVGMLEMTDISDIIRLQYTR